MSHTRGTVPALKAGAAVVTLLAATLWGAFAVGAVGAPSVVGVENRFGTVTARSSLLGRSVAVPDVTRGVDTNVVGGFRSDERRPVNASSPLVDDPVAYVERTDAEWGEVNEETTESRRRCTSTTQTRTRWSSRRWATT